MRVTIHQPEYMPWLGFFNKLSMADIYVALDNVQYRHKYFQNRNKIRSASGETWLNVPILIKSRRFQLLNEIEINNTEKRWRNRNWMSLYLNYIKSPYFAKYADYFHSLYSNEWQLLSRLNLDIIKKCMSFLGIKTKVIVASDLGMEGKGEELILGICRKLNATIYISGISGIAGKGENYENKFLEYNIKVVYQKFMHPIYKQLHEPFIPCMSVVDLLFNYGEHSLDIINGIGVPAMKKIFY